MLVKGWKNVHRFEIADDGDACGFKFTLCQVFQADAKFTVLVLIDNDLRTIRQDRSQRRIPSEGYRPTSGKVAIPGIARARQRERWNAKYRASSARVRVNDSVASLVIDDGIAAIAGANEIDIVPGAALQDVIAFAATQGIVTRATGERVRAIAADQGIVTGPTCKRIVVGATFEVIIAVASCKRIPSPAAVQVIGVVSALQGIAPIARKTDADGIDLLQRISAYHPDAVVLPLRILE